MILQLRYYGDPVLRQKSSPVEEITPAIRKLVADMEETMVLDGRGMGLAAVQVGELLRLFLTKAPIEEEDGSFTEGSTRVYINPELSDPSEEVYPMEEGCLSIPGVRGVVVRPSEITARWMDLEGRFHEERLTGLEARIAMHENDHINGVLFPDRMRGRPRDLLNQPLAELKKRTQKRLKGR